MSAQQQNLLNRIALKEASLSGASPAMQDQARYHLEHAYRAALTVSTRIKPHDSRQNRR